MALFVLFLPFLKEDDEFIDFMCFFVSNTAIQGSQMSSKLWFGTRQFVMHGVLFSFSSKCVLVFILLNEHIVQA